MLKYLAYATLFSAVCLTTAAANDWALGATTSTLGVGLQAAVPVSQSTNLRATLNRFSQSVSNDFGNIQYNADVDLNTIGVLADWHPFTGGFRLSGGVVINSNTITGVGTPNAAQNFKIGNTEYGNLDIAADTKLGFKKFAPYLGFGYDGVAPRRKGLSFTADVGVMMQGSPKFDFQVVGADAALVNQADIDKEIAQIEDDISTFKIWPVVAVGLTYQF